MRILHNSRVVSSLLSFSVAAVCASVTCNASTPAQGPISTERPGLLITPALVPEGCLQVEAGIPNVVYTRGGGVHSSAYNFPTLVRYGLSSRAEVRLFSSVWNVVRDESSGPTNTTSGFGDVELSTKIALCTQDGMRPLASMIAGVRLPVGADEFTTRQAGYSLNFAGDWDIGGGNTLRGLAGLVSTPSGSDDSSTGNLGLSINRAIDDQWGAFLEAGFFPSFSSGAEDLLFAGGGLSYLLNSDAQLDAFGDFGLNSDSPDATIGLGVSMRF